MKKVSTAAAQASRNISQQTLTVGLDLGDRNSWYCVLDEAGQIQLERRVRDDRESDAGSLRRHAAQPDRSGDRNTFGLDQPLAQRVGTRSDRGECAQGAADRGKPQERRPAGCADAGPAGADRSRVAVSGEASQCAGASGSGDDSRPRQPGAPGPLSLQDETEVENQVAAPAETRTPNVHRAKRSLLESASGSMASAATRREKSFGQQKNTRTYLTPTGLLMEGV
jgi:hypothetical protein